MPIIIYPEDDPKDQVALLCDGNWNLTTQVSALEAWLDGNKGKMKSGRYIADLGFCVRKDALGGGAVISPEMMRNMTDLGISLWLSEYPSDKEI